MLLIYSIWVLIVAVILYWSVSSVINEEGELPEDKEFEFLAESIGLTPIQLIWLIVLVMSLIPPIGTVTILIGIWDTIKGKDNES